jgi:hypothetical protein
MKTVRLAALLGIGALATACGSGGGGTSTGTSSSGSSGGGSATSSSHGNSSTTTSGGSSAGSGASSTSTVSTASATTSSSSGSTSRGSSSGASATAGSTGSSGGVGSTGGSPCTPGAVLAAFQPCASSSGCSCPQICVDPGIGMTICETPCALTAFGGSCQVINPGDGTCQPAQITEADGGASFAGFCLPNGTEVNGWSGAAGGDCSLVTAEQFPSAGTSDELCVAGQICPAVAGTCSSFCATPGQAGNCGTGLQCNFLFSGVSSAGYCGACTASTGPCVANTDCCAGLSCTAGACG